MSNRNQDAADLSFNPAEEREFNRIGWRSVWIVVVIAVVAAAVVAKVGGFW